jgi:cysteinyl-tRNA synthetase
LVAFEFLEQFDRSLANNLNVNDALGHLFKLIRETNKLFDAGQVTSIQAQQLQAAWNIFSGVLGLGQDKLLSSHASLGMTATVDMIVIPANIAALRDQRAEARKAKNFAQSDELRKAIEALGWKVKDTAKGQELLPG